jgi:Cathepsin propeptide inhibitor domain (I29)
MLASRFLVFGLLVAVAATSTLQDFEDWAAFKVQFKKTYPRADKQRRFEIFVNTKQEIEEHNNRYDQGLETYTMGINSFSDLEPAEFQQLYTGTIVQ